MADKEFQTVDDATIADCCDALREGSHVRLDIGMNVYAGEVRAIRLMDDGQFNITIRERG